MKSSELAIATQIGQDLYKNTVIDESGNAVYLKPMLIPSGVEPVEEVKTEIIEKPLPTKAGEVYFPININLPNGSSANGQNQNNAPTITEAEKRKRTIIGAVVVLVVLVVLIGVVSLRKK
jgi:hypothetical protein